MMIRSSSILAWPLALSLVLFGCGGGNEVPEPNQNMPERSIANVLADHTPSLMAMEGVVGTAQSEREDGTPVIWVLVAELTPELKAELPAEIEGYPVEIHVTGNIEAFDEE